MNRIKLDKIGIILVILDVLASVIVLSMLPERIPSHWDLYGNIDNWSSKYTIIFIALGIAAVYLLLSIGFEKVEALRNRRMVIWSILRSILVLFLFFHFAIIYIALGYNLPMTKVLGAFFGLIFVVFGNHFPQLKPNKFVGIRTTWTLKDADTWHATHRIGGYTSLLIGIVMIVLSILLRNEVALIGSFAAMIVWIIFIIVYSFTYYRSKVTKAKI